MNSILLFLLLLLSPLRNLAQDIFTAARSGDLERIRYLHSLSADTVNTVNESEFSPLIIAAYRGQHEAMALLLKLGANPNTNSPEGTALIALAYKGDAEGLKLLLLHKPKLDLCNPDGLTALMYASLGNHIEIVKLLLASGANKTLRSVQGSSALDFARKNQNTDLILILQD